MNNCNRSMVNRDSVLAVQLSNGAFLSLHRQYNCMESLLWAERNLLCNWQTQKLSISRVKTLRKLIVIIVELGYAFVVSNCMLPIVIIERRCGNYYVGSKWLAENKNHK